MKRVFLFLLGFALLFSIPAKASVEHVRYADGTSQTLYEIQIPQEISPEQIDSVTILLNNTPLPLGKDDFSLWGFGSFLSELRWELGKPALGKYAFIISTGGVQVKTYDTQTENRDIPNADVSTFSIQGNTFFWGEVSLPGIPLYYRLVIDDGLTGNRVYNSNRELNMLSHTVPVSKLVPGKTYKWHVRVSDAADWVPEQNRSNSQSLQFTWMGLSAQIQGKITDAVTGYPIPGATISLEPGTITLTSQTDGSFSSSGIPAGTYSAQISAPNYNTKALPVIALAPGLPNQLDVLLAPYTPQVTSAVAEPPSVGNDGLGKTLLTARVTHPLGPSKVDSVLADLTPIGGSPEQAFYDDGTHGDMTGGDEIYSYSATVAKGINAKRCALIVTAIDLAGKENFGSISLSVTDKRSGSVQSSQSDSQIFDNTLDGQTLNIHFDFTRAISSLKALKADCQIQLTILGPDESVYGTYSFSESIDVSIPNAAAGEWEYVTTNQCTSALSYEIETSGSGTGLLVGRVLDGITGAGVKGASVNCNTGGATLSLDQGYYSGVAVAGTGVVTTAKTGYRTNVKSGVHVKSGTTTNLNIQVVPENASAQAVPSGVHIFNILDPAEDPKPPTQPFAIKVSGSGLEFNLVFPRYQQAVDLYLAFVPSSGGHAGKLFLVDEKSSIVEFGGTLRAWKRASTQEESAQIPIPGEYPLGAYTLYSLVTTDSSTLTNYDLSYFTTTPPQPAPVGQNVTIIPNPSEAPNPLLQPMAVKVTEGNFFLNAHFPLQAQPVAIFLAYTTPRGELYLIKSDHSTELFSEILLPWRENVKAEQELQELPIPMIQTPPGTYHFYSLVTTDPTALSNYDLIHFIFDTN